MFKVGERVLYRYKKGYDIFEGINPALKNRVGTIVRPKDKYNRYGVLFDSKFKDGHDLGSMNPTWQDRGFFVVSGLLQKYIISEELESEDNWE